VILRDRDSDFPKAVQRLPATDAFLLSPEHIAGFSPELVLLGNSGGNRFEGLLAVGLVVGRFDPQTHAQILSTVERLGKLCGHGNEAVALKRKLSAQFAQVQAQVKQRDPSQRPSVFVELEASNPMKPWTAGKGSLIDHLIAEAGGKNIYANLPRAYAAVGIEEIQSRHPDLVLIAHRGQTAAIQARMAEIRDVDPDVLVRPGPRFFTGLELLAQRFTNIDPSTGGSTK
jgi:iron complex transport system substrate-binding protein